MDSVTPTIKAVGFSFISPEVVLIMADTSANRLHFYPSAADGKTLDLSEDRPHWVLLKSPDHIGSMASYADHIDRLIIFGRPDELLGLGLPILDANVTNGQVEVIRRSNVKEMLDRIQQEAVSLSLTETEKAYQGLKQKERTKMKPQPSGKTFVQQLKDLKAAINQLGNGFNFIQQIGVPSVLRLLGDTDREEFKHVCKLMVDKGGVPDQLARTYFRWVEGFEGEGTELGKAVEQLLYPQEGGRSMRPEEEWQAQVEPLAKKMRVDAGDLEFVARSYYQLMQERQAKAPEPATEKDSSWEDSPEDQPTAPEVVDASEDEQEVTSVDSTDEEEGDGANTAAFGWNDEDPHPSRRATEENEGGDEEEENKDNGTDEEGMFGQNFGDFDQ
jgi:hypothetical protein